MKSRRRWQFKAIINNKNFTVGYNEFKLLEYILKNKSHGKTYRKIGEDLKIKRDIIKNSIRSLYNKELIDSNKKITDKGEKTINLLKEKVIKKEEELQTSNYITNNLNQLDLDEFPAWFQKSLQSKEYASSTILLSIDLEGSIASNGITVIYQTGKENSALLLLLSLIIHYHYWNPAGLTIFDDLRNGYVRISVNGLKEIYSLGCPLANPKKNLTAENLTSILSKDIEPGWFRYIIKNKSIELIALAMEEEFMIKNLCLRLKEGDPTQIWMYKACKYFDLTTSKSEETMKSHNMFILRADSLPYIIKKVRTFIIPSKKLKILKLLERHSRNIKGSHKYSSKGISIKDIVFDILKKESIWMTTKNVYYKLPNNIKTSNSLIWSALKNLYQENKIERKTIRGRSINWEIFQWKIKDSY